MNSQTYFISLAEEDRNRITSHMPYQMVRARIILQVNKKEKGKWEIVSTPPYHAQFFEKYKLKIPVHIH